MVRLNYQSLVTKENIKYYLSIIKGNEQTKKDFINLISKIDIRISTEPVIVGNEFYYKIWILKKGTKYKAHIKDYYSLELLNKKLQSSPITLAEILEMIRINADVPDDFEEYCEMRFQDPSDPVCRSDYLDDLRRAERFKKFLSQDEIRSMSFSFYQHDNNNNREQKIEVLDMNNISNLKSLGYTIVLLNDKKEYDKLADLDNTLEYYAKITESYGFDRYTYEFNEKLFPVTKDDREMKNIKKDIDDYNQALEEYTNYLQYLIQKYKIKQSGNIIKRIAFTFRTGTEQQMNNKPIPAIVDYRFFIT